MSGGHPHPRPISALRTLPSPAGPPHQPQASSWHSPDLWLLPGLLRPGQSERQEGMSPKHTHLCIPRPKPSQVSAEGRRRRCRLRGRLQAERCTFAELFGCLTGRETRSSHDRFIRKVEITGARRLTEATHTAQARGTPQDTLGSPRSKQHPRTPLDTPGASSTPRLEDHCPFSHLRALPTRVKP